MKVRIKFSKQGHMKFIGHLDIMRYFQKAIRRTDIDIKYSEGFSPHQVMSFAAPLGVGLTSNGEYMDIELNSMTDGQALVSTLNAVMADGIEILSCHRLLDTAKNAMSLVAAADYTVTFREGQEPEDIKGFLKGLEKFCSQDEILVTKKTKKSEREVDIKTGIYELRIEGAAVFMKLSSGSANNLKPELVMDSYAASRGEELSPFACRIQREEMYGDLGEAGNQEGPLLCEQGRGRILVPLAHIGESISPEFDGMERSN